MSAAAPDEENDGITRVGGAAEGKVGASGVYGGDSLRLPVPAYEGMFKPTTTPYKTFWERKMPSPLARDN